ncbi:MAG: hypothetical protein IJM79_02335 [Erysipelotrichaceae bacterium]|nr:hypothetical protein [Erysipelotrichaceae bacterium]
MQIRNRYYPYPVIMEDGDYYLGSTFTSSVRQSLDGYNVKLEIEVCLSDQKMKNMIESGQLAYVHHIECSHTCFRKAITTFDDKAEILLKDSEVNGTVQVCSFVVANRNIDKYTNDSFSADYRGWKFDIDKGCVMAIGNEYDLSVNKVKDDLSNTSSIFSIVKNMDPLACRMIIELGKEKIVVSLPEQTYNQYTSTQTFGDIQPIMHSMIIIPALLFTFSELIKAGDQLYEYEDCRWFKGLKKACNAISIDLTEESIKNIDAVKVSQQLLDNPIVEAIEFCAIGGASYED